MTISLTFRRWCACCLVAFLLAAETAPAADPEEIQQEHPSFFVRVDVDHQTRQYRQGDPLRIGVVAESDAYAYVLYKQADGKILQVFPNSEQPDNRIFAKQITRIPSQQDSFSWCVGAPFGKETIKLIASKTPLPELSADDLYEGRFKSVTAKSLDAAAAVLKTADPTTWAEDSVDVTTFPDGPAGEISSGRRVGLFIGISDYQFAEEYYESRKWDPRLRSAASDAKLLSQVMKEVSRLDEVRLLVNEQATKAGIHQAVASWLPSATKPGDTVVIFVETHGAQIPDDNDDERDGHDEYIMTHDLVDFGLLQYLRQQAANGMLKPNHQQAMQELSSFAGSLQRRLGGLDAQRQATVLNMHLTDKTGITDDQFAKWLQALSGRKVVVVTATCHAGFAVGAKGHAAITSSPAAGRFDFLAGELGRLKDIGQPDTAVITACTAAQVSWARTLSPETVAMLNRTTGAALQIPPDQLVHTLTFGLVGSLIAAPPRQPLDRMFQDVHDRVMHLIATEFKPDPEGKVDYHHEPQFYNFSTRPIYLKP